MEETSAISMELVLAALIALAVLLLLGWYFKQQDKSPGF